MKWQKLLQQKISSSNFLFHISIKYTHGKDNVVIAGEQYTGEDRPSFICNYCNRTLTKLTDRNSQNESYYCNSCGIDFQPDNENVRRETKLTVPDRNTETLAATTPGIPDISIHHTPEPKGTLKVLQQKGIKIKDYKKLMAQVELYHNIMTIPTKRVHICSFCGPV